ncbi:MAG: ParA family protein [Sporomusa sp.]
MKIINIANRKGGVGKTVISGNIAYELSRIGYLVLMVDLDSQCDLAKSIGQMARPFCFFALGENHHGCGER